MRRGPATPVPKGVIHLKSFALIALIWGAIAAVWWLTTGAELARAQKPAPPTWEDIASFYSGGNMHGPITYDWTNTRGTTGMPGSGQIRLNPELQASRDAFVKGIRAKKYADRRGAVVLGMPFLSTLIHEALHNRAASDGFDPAGETAPTDLGVRMVPDLLQRFFGVRMDSRLGKEAVDMVLKSLRRP